MLIRHHPASQPRYGGTETLFAETLAGLSISAVGFADGIDEAALTAAAQDAMRKGRVAMIFTETPANPTNSLVDIAMVRRIADTIGRSQGHTPLVVCDNTLLGPVFQRPIEHGAERVENSDFLANVGRNAGVSPRRELSGRPSVQECTGAGSTFSFDIVGGQAAAFKFLNALQIFKLALPAST